MRISRRSTISRALAPTMLLTIAGAAHAGETAPPAAGARTRIESEGDAAMDRVKQALGRAKRAPIASPALPSATDNATQRRAFNGLAQRKVAPEMEKRARANVDVARAALARERSAASARIAQALGLEAPEAAALGAATPAPLTRSRVPLLMVSSAMPVAVLRTYAAQLERAGGVMAFRGMPGGMTRGAPMAKFSAQVLRIDPGCEGPACAMRNVQIIVDPLVFRQHDVTRVPALAMIPGDPTQPYCERDDASPVSAHVIYGDAALSGLFEEFARLGGKEDVRDALARLAPR